MAKPSLQIDFQELLNEEFAEYKEYHLFIVVILFFAIAVLQFFQAWYFSRNIESFKNQLKLSEIKFSRFNELQIESLRNLYVEIVSFQTLNHQLFYKPYMNHNIFKERILEWQNQYDSLMKIFLREKIVLPKSLVPKVKEFWDNGLSIKVTLFEEYRDIIKLEERFESSDPLDIYETSGKELVAIEERIKNLRSHPQVKMSKNLFKELTKDIEEYFHELVK